MKDNREIEFSNGQAFAYLAVSTGIENAEREMKSAIEPPERELSDEEKLELQRKVSDSAKGFFEILTEEERNNKVFRLNILARCMSSAGSAIVRNTDAFAEAIKYCPECIGTWYDIGRFSNTLGLVPIRDEVMAKLVKESPEVLERLPERVIMLNKSAFLEIIGTNRKLLELPVIQRIMEKDKEFELELKDRLISNQAEELDKLNGELAEKDKKIADLSKDSTQK